MWEGLSGSQKISAAHAQMSVRSDRRTRALRQALGVTCADTDGVLSPVVKAFSNSSRKNCG